MPNNSASVLMQKIRGESPLSLWVKSTFEFERLAASPEASSIKSVFTVPFTTRGPKVGKPLCAKVEVTNITNKISTTPAFMGDDDMRQSFAMQRGTFIERFE